MIHSDSKVTATVMEPSESGRSGKEKSLEAAVIENVESVGEILLVIGMKRGRRDVRAAREWWTNERVGVAKLKSGAVQTNKSWVARVLQVSLAAPQRCIAPRLPAWVFLTKIYVFPEALELVFTLGAQCAVLSSWASWTLIQHLSDFVFKGVFRGIRNGIFQLTHVGHVTKFEHV